MNLYELVLKIKSISNFDSNLWQKEDKCRLYFDYPSKVTLFLELLVVGNDVKSVISKCYYIGKTPTSKKWTLNYTKEAREFVDTIAEYAMDYINK